MQLSSPAFDTGGKIPQKFTGEGDDVSPTLEWRDVPPGTKSFLLVCEDPDAPGGTFHHWAVWDIPEEWNRLDEGGAGKRSQLRQAVNDFGKAGYGGPLPPKGDRPHHYHFKIAALSRESLPVGDRAKAQQVMAAARPFVLGEAELVGLYRR